MADKRFRQGVFVPINRDKFIGTKAFYRSGLELKFMRFCDSNPNVLKWGSENVVVPYISPLDNKVHRYFVDNFVTIKENNTITRYLIEIKPDRQTRPPVTKYKKKEHLIYEQATYAVNSAKWEAARKICNQKGWQFLIITEKHLK